MSAAIDAFIRDAAESLIPQALARPMPPERFTRLLSVLILRALERICPFSPLPSLAEGTRYPAIYSLKSLRFSTNSFSPLLVAGSTSNENSEYSDLTNAYCSFESQPHQYGNASPWMNCLASRNFTADSALKPETASPRSRSLANLSKRTAVIEALDFIPWNQPNPPSAFWQANILVISSESGISTVRESLSLRATRRTYNASESDSTSFPAGSALSGMASMSIWRMSISLYSAPFDVVPVNCPWSIFNTAFSSAPGRTTAECASVMVWAAS